MTKQLPSLAAVIALYLLHALAYGMFFGFIGGLIGPAWLIVGGVLGSWRGCWKAERIINETYGR